MLTTLFNTVFPAFALIFIGWFYARCRPEVSTKSLNHLALYVGMPSIIIKSVVDMEFGDIPVGLILLASVLASVVPAVIGYIWLRL